MVCVKEIAGNKVEVGVFEETPEEDDGTDLEANFLTKLTAGLKATLDEISKIEADRASGVDLSDPYCKLAMAVKARFQRKE